MSSYFTDNQILCENCEKYFVSYTHILTEMDLDIPHKEISRSYEETLNRIVCPLCKQEFTYETDILFHSFTHRFAVYCSYAKMFLNVADFKTAMKICGFDDWTFRVCTYSYEAYEKIRIFTCGLDDTKINSLKLQSFPTYKDMNIKDEYISFENTDNNNLYFSHRDFTGKILNKLSISKSDYDKTPAIPIPKGDWCTIDKTSSIKKLEETK